MFNQFFFLAFALYLQERLCFLLLSIVSFLLSTICISWSMVSPVCFYLFYGKISVNSNATLSMED